MKIPVRSTTGARNLAAPPPMTFKMPFEAATPEVAVDTADVLVVTMLMTALTIFEVTAVATNMFAELLARSRAGPTAWVKSIIARWNSSASSPFDVALFSFLAFDIVAESPFPTTAFARLPDADCSSAIGLMRRVSAADKPLEEPLKSPPPRVAILG